MPVTFACLFPGYGCDKAKLLIEDSAEIPDARRILGVPRRRDELGVRLRLTSDPSASLGQECLQDPLSGLLVEAILWFRMRRAKRFFQKIDAYPLCATDFYQGRRSPRLPSYHPGEQAQPHR